MQSENQYIATTKLLQINNKKLIVEIYNYCDITNITIDEDDPLLVANKLRSAFSILPEYKKLYYNTFDNSLSITPNTKDTIIVPFEHLIYHIYDLS